MPLPTQKSTPGAAAPSMLVLYGPPKVGKTTAVAALDNALILDCEQPPGTRYVSCMSVQIDKYKTFIDTCREIVRTGRKYKYVVVDTIDALERMCTAEANIRYKMSNMGQSFTGNNILTELAKGAGYPWLWDCVRDVLDEAAKTADHVILIGHLKEKLLPDGMTSEDSDGADLDLTGKVKNIVCARADAIGLVKRKLRPHKPGEPKVADLWVNFRTTDMTNCGIRIERLAGREFVFSAAGSRDFNWAEIFPAETKEAK